MIAVGRKARALQDDFRLSRAGSPDRSEEYLGWQRPQTRRRLVGTKDANERGAAALADLESSANAVLQIITEACREECDRCYPEAATELHQFRRRR